MQAPSAFSDRRRIATGSTPTSPPIGSQGRSPAPSCASAATRPKTGRSRRPSGSSSTTSSTISSTICNPIVTTCDRTTHRHKYGVDASYWAALGYYDVHEKLLAANPNLLLENCSGGGHIKDFGVIQRSHYTVTTDTLSNLPDRQSIYDSTFAFPPLVLQAYTYDNFYPVKGDEPGPFLWRSGMMSAWQIDPTDTLDWTDAERDSARRAADIYKQWIRPMLADVKVHHILPRPDGMHWDGMFYFSAASRRGMLYIFRPDAPDAQNTIRLKGLAPDQGYWVWSEDASVPPGSSHGSTVDERGFDDRAGKPVFERPGLRAGGIAGQAARSRRAGGNFGCAAPRRVADRLLRRRRCRGTRRNRQQLSCDDLTVVGLPRFAGRRQSESRESDHACRQCAAGG